MFVLFTFVHTNHIIYLLLWWSNIGYVLIICFADIDIHVPVFMRVDRGIFKSILLLWTFMKIRGWYAFSISGCQMLRSGGVWLMQTHLKWFTCLSKITLLITLKFVPWLTLTSLNSSEWLHSTACNISQPSVSWNWGNILKLKGNSQISISNCISLTPSNDCIPVILNKKKTIGAHILTMAFHMCVYNCVCLCVHPSPFVSTHGCWHFDVSYSKIWRPVGMAD